MSLKHWMWTPPLPKAPTLVVHYKKSTEKSFSLECLCHWLDWRTEIPGHSLTVWIEQIDEE
jgi:hypothetical protein